LGTSIKNGLRGFLEFVLELGDIMSVPESREFFDGISLGNPAHG